MKLLYISIISLMMLSSCQSEKKQTQNEETMNDVSIAEKIAIAHGLDNWKNVNEVRFTFKVDRDTIKGQGRSWIWNPKKDDITMIMGDAVVTYNRSQIDSLHMAADRAFINDKFWLLIPFQLVWDSGASISEPKEMTSPIKKETLQMITITYPTEGGYTPGDAYDIYFGDDYFIKEWTYRRGNSSEPSLSNTFENYQDFNGIKIAIDHKKDNGKWNLNFADVSIITE